MSPLVVATRPFRWSPMPNVLLIPLLALGLVSAAPVLRRGLAAQEAGPELPASVARVLSPFRAPPDSAEVADAVDDLREVRPPLRSARRHLLAGEMWRLADEPELALAHLDSVPADDPRAPLTSLERARVRLAAAPGRDPEAGARDFWRACEAMDDSVKAELWRDLVPLSTPEERTAWDELEPGPHACQWVRRFVEERAYRAGVGVDERLRIHYERLQQARSEHWLYEPRSDPAISDLHGRPEGLGIDDAGLLLVRMARPTIDMPCPVPGVDLTALCWAYHRPGGYRLYFLSVVRRTGRYPADRDLRIQRDFGPRAYLGDLYFHSVVMKADLGAATLHWLKHASVPPHLDPRLDLHDGLEEAMDKAEAGIHRRRIQLATIRYTEEALEQIPDAPEVNPEVRMAWEALRFLNPGSGRWQTWILTSARAGDLTWRETPDGSGREAAVRLRVAARTAEGVALDSAARRIVRPEPLPDDAGLDLRATLLARPGPLPLTVALRDGNAERRGNWAQDTLQVPEVLEMPMLSDIAVAQDSGGTWTRDGATFLDVSPAHVTDERGRVHVYFEAYGMPAGTEYEVEVRLARAGEGGSPFERPPASLPFRLRFPSRMPAAGIGRHHVRLDLGQTRPGGYTLAVRLESPGMGPSLPAVTYVRVAER